MKIASTSTQQPLRKAAGSASRPITGSVSESTVSELSRSSLPLPIETPSSSEVVLGKEALKARLIELVTMQNSLKLETKDLESAVESRQAAFSRKTRILALVLAASLVLSIGTGGYFAGFILVEALLGLSLASYFGGAALGLGLSYFCWGAKGRVVKNLDRPESEVTGSIIAKKVREIFQPVVNWIYGKDLLTDQKRDRQRLSEISHEMVSLVDQYEGIRDSLLRLI